MRYRATGDNLVLEVPLSEMEDWVRRVVRLLVPRYTSKIYLMSEDAGIRVSGIEQPGLAVVQAGQEPSNFLQSFRLIARHGELIVVSSRGARLGREEWRSVAEELSANAT
jgi:hypothetical protein